ncbi:MAG: hypothetical protein ACOC0Z_00985 [Halohasta sp.]
MSLRLSTALTDGFKRAITKTGGILFVVFLVLQLVNTASINTVTTSSLPAEAAVPVGLTLPLPASVAGGLSVVSYLCLAVFFVVVTRALARPIAELSTFPSELYTRRIGWATLSMVGASILAFLAIGVGYVLLIIPGIFLTIAFLFYMFAVSVEDRGVIGSLRRSWDLGRGNRIRLLGFFVLLIALGFVSGATTTLFQVAGIPLVGDLIVVLVSSVFGVVYNGILASAYLQLAGTDPTAF